MKVTPVRSTDGKPRGYSFQCPGCSDWHGSPSYHVFHTEPWDSGHYRDGKWIPKAGPVWEFDGDEGAPTFSPSLLVFEGRYEDGTIGHPRCHSFVRAGRIQYLSDCGHSLAGQTVDLPDVEGS